MSRMLTSKDSKGVFRVPLRSVGKVESFEPFRTLWKYSIKISTSWSGESAKEPLGILGVKGKGWTIFVGACTCMSTLSCRATIEMCAAGTLL